MTNATPAAPQGSSTLLKALVFAMFAMFAMTTDSVGSVIPEVIREFDLSLTAAGSFQYSMGVVLSALLAHWHKSTVCEPHSFTPKPLSKSS